MNRGRRYEEPKLNMKKVFATILAVIVIIMSIVVLVGILGKDKEQGKITSEDYFSAYKDNKWGVINSKGENVIDPSYAEMIVVPNSKKDVFICTYDTDYDTGTYKTKALNSKNEEILTQYDQIEAISNQDENNNLWYEDMVLKVKKDGKYGLINLDGKELLSCEYDKISALPGIKATLKVEKDGKIGIVTTEGKMLIKPEYQEIQALGKESKDGFIVKNEKYGIVNTSNEVVLEPKYDEITNIYGNEIYVVKKDGKQIAVKKDGTEVLTSGYDEITKILKSSDGAIIKKQNKYGVIKLDGTTLIDPIYEDLKETKTGIYIAKQNGKYGIINQNKENKIDFKYVSLVYNEKADLYIAEDDNYNNEIINSEYETKQTGILVDLDTDKGYIELRQNNENKYYNFKFEEKNVADIFTSNTLYLSKKDGKYGFVDKDGKVVVDYKYDDATEQNSYGYAGIKKDGKWGAINSKGEVVQDTTYDLEDYLKIDFIGRWHFGKDINMNYYNQL